MTGRQELLRNQSAERVIDDYRLLPIDCGDEVRVVVDDLGNADV
nr:hypothetical protein [Rhodococcus sp. P1Y]